MLKRMLEKPGFKIVMRHLPTLTLVMIVALSLILGKSLSFESLLQRKPKGLIAAALFFLFIFTVKSMSYLVPIIALYAAVGTLFPLYLALAINVFGAAIVVTIPYWLGYYHGAGLMGTLLSKFPKIEEYIKSREEKSLLISCFPRTIVFVPLKTVSVYLGSLKIPFIKYLLGSVLGIFPMLAAVTFIGQNITEPNSPGFRIAGIIIILSASISLALYFFTDRLKRKRK